MTDEAETAWVEGTMTDQAIGGAAALADGASVMGDSGGWHELAVVAAVAVAATLFLVRRFSRRGGACASCPAAGGACAGPRPDTPPAAERPDPPA